MSHPLPGGKPWAPADSRPGAASSPSRPSSPRPRHRKWVNGVFKNSNSRELNGDSGAGFPEHRPHSPSSRAVLAPPTLPLGEGGHPSGFCGPAPLSQSTSLSTPTLARVPGSFYTLRQRPASRPVAWSPRRGLRPVLHFVDRVMAGTGLGGQRHSRWFSEVTAAGASGAEGSPGPSLPTWVPSPQAGAGRPRGGRAQGRGPSPFTPQR